MPNRILYSTLLNSQKVNQLKPAEFELYIRLLLVADDFGRYSGQPVRIARSCWPDREDITGKIVEPLLKRIAAVGLVVMYLADGDKCLQITAWNQRTRQMSSKWPAPNDNTPSIDGHMTVSCQSVDRHMLTETETETETETYICTAPQSDAEQNVMKLPLIDKTEYGISQSQIDKWTELYRAVDITQELNKMIGWLEANPANQKTRKGIMRFVANWLARAQDGARVANNAPNSKPTNKGNFTQREYTKDYLDSFYEDPGVTNEKQV